MASLISWFARKELWEKGNAYLKEYGVKKSLARFVSLMEEKIWEKYFLTAENELRYQKWWKSQLITEKKRQKINRQLEGFKYKPVISVLVPVYNTPARYLEECLRSVEEQIYPYWELCISDDNSQDLGTRKVLAEYQRKARKDPRIKLFLGKKNRHISQNTNHALKLARGEFVALLDHDDLLHPAALYLAAKELNQKSDWDFIYSDEDKINDKGKHSEPHFKPDWNPDLLLSMNYICHLAVIRRSLMKKIGGLRTNFIGAQDYDLFLRLTEKTKKIKHIPHVLYHWRKIPGSTSLIYSYKGYADKNARKALFYTGKRRKENWKVSKGLATTSFRVKRKVSEEKRVAIVIPFRDKVGLLKKCVNSILYKTHYRNFRIVLVDNGSIEKSTLRYLKSLENNSKIKILRYPHPFNFAAINNWAVKQIGEPLLLFLNNDITVINPDWLSAMVEQAQRPEVGAVGAKLYYPNGRIQHAGVVLGVGKYKNKSFGVAGHSHKYFPGRSNGYFEQINVIRDYSAVKGACLMTKRDLFLRMGGFDEKNFGVAWNDIDFCLRLRKKGYLVVYTPYAQLYHYESLSRGSDEDGEKMKRFHRECETMYKKWSPAFARDPYYNPNLSLEDESWRIKERADKNIY